jgi:hypothetical protein
MCCILCALLVAASLAGQVSAQAERRSGSGGRSYYVEQAERERQRRLRSEREEDEHRRRARMRKQQHEDWLKQQSKQPVYAPPD